MPVQPVPAGISANRGPSPPSASMKFSGAALFETCGPAMDCPARQFLPGVRPPPLCPPGTSRPRKKAPHSGGVFFYSGKSRISCASADSRWERDRTRSSHKAGELLHCHRSHRVSGRCPPPLCPPGTFSPTQKDPARGRSLTGTKSGLWATGTAAKRLGDTLRASCIVIVLS